MDRFFKAHKGITTSNTTATSNLEPGILTIGGSIINTTAYAAGANVILTTTDVKVGNTVANLFANSILVKVSNSTATANHTPIGFTAGVVVANTLQVSVGANVFVNTTTVFIGNTVNVVANSSTVKVGANVTLSAISLTIGSAVVNSSVVSTGQVTITGAINANGGIGSAGHVLTSDGTKAYWTTPGAGFASLSTEDQALSGGVIITEKDHGTKSSGTFTLDMGDRPHQKYVCAGAHTLAPGTNIGSCLIIITMTTGAATITTSGWTKVAGDPFTYTVGHKFVCHASVTAAGSLLIVQAMQ